MEDTEKSPLHIVGVGASAGGLEALESLFGSLPHDSGLAFVVVQHLSPDYRSRVDELIGRRTSVPIVHARSGMVIAPDHIYLAPARHDIIVSEGRFILEERSRQDGFHLPIDNFLRSLATNSGRNAIAVVLSGTGTDGSRGAMAVHESGGLVVAQEPSSAGFDGMPAAVINTGAADVVLEPTAMPEALRRYAHEAVSRQDLAGTELLAPEDPLSQMLGLLRQRHGIDFSDYKPSTVRRRVDRRVQLGMTDSLESYVDRLRNDPLEVDALYRDLLIGVTRFFRDDGVFDHLRNEIVPSLVQSAGREGVRIWDAGCATGEEAYSLAMLFAEEARKSAPGCRIQIFATDAHSRSLEHAGRGVYESPVVADVPPALRERYFVTNGDGRLRVRKDLRKLVVFARQDVLQDAPFTKMDLVVCRNLLIYLQPGAQRRAMTLFHFALRANGVLLLGSSETPGELSSEFDTIDSKHRVYRKRRDVRIALERARGRTFRGPSPRGRDSRPSILMRESSSPIKRMLPLYDAVLDEVLPPSFLVDEEHQLLHSFGDAQHLLTIPPGRVSARLPDLVPESLRAPVIAALRQAHRTDEQVRYAAGDGEGVPSGTLLTIDPLRAADGSMAFLVRVEAVEDGVARSFEDDASRSADGPSYVRILEQELSFTRENLQATVEELEASNEELQATNEELVASNEELQSTNEELQSVNEELHGLNSEHQRQIQELTELTDDMDNLMQSTQIGVAFLDGDLRIRRFTDRIASIFRLSVCDIGRDFSDLVRNLDSPTILDDVRAVLERGVEREQELEVEGRAELLRILPYRVADEITGVVLTLIDITSMRRSEAAVDRLTAILAATTDAVIGFDRDGRVTDANDVAAATYADGEASSLIGERLSDLVEKNHQAEIRSVMERVFAGESVEPLERLVRDAQGHERWVSEAYFAVEDESGAMIARDITPQKRAEEDVRGAVRQRERFISVLSHELRNPMMALRTATESLDIGDPKARTRAAEIIGRQVEHVGRLLDDLLDIGRLRHGAMTLDERLTDLRDVVAPVLDGFARSAEDAGVRLEIQVSDDPCWVRADPSRLRQLLTNLLDNALKYTPEGERIELEIAHDEEHVCVIVTDHGVGIAPDRLHEVFEAFVQGGSSAIRHRGRSMGLGLAIVQAIVTAHGGEVCIDSDGVGKGTRARVILPRASASEHPAPSDEDDEREPTGLGAGICVLLLEDEDDNREMLGLALARHGFDVTPVRTGRSAVGAFEGRSFDVGVLDIGLPDMSGLDVARAARRLHPDLPLIALTGYGSRADGERIVDAGFDRHLVKPIRAEKLRNAIRALTSAADAPADE